MQYQEIINEAIKALTVNRLRTGLAVLGIIIGIGSVIALISLGQASQKSIENQIQSLGANLLTVIPGGTNAGNVRGAAGSATTLTLEDAQALKSQLPETEIANVSPEYQSRSQVTAGRNNTNTQIIGVYPQYADIHKIQVQQGVFITQRDVDAMSKVAVIGPTAATDLFGENVDPVGQSIRIEGQSFIIVGVTASKGGTGFNNPDDAIYIPLSTAQKQLFGAKNISSIAVEATTQNIMTQAQDDIGYLLLQRHKISDPTQADFSIFSQNDILSTATSVTGTFTTLLGGIAAISLLVGGIGIMNIMLVTVTERTREIGLRKALGAKKKIIILQFLIESIILTLTGGVVGMIGGVTVSYFLTQRMGLAFYIAPESVILAIGVSATIGIIFGLYPARKAANLQPIEALRYE